MSVPELILASRSPRRHTLMTLAGYNFQTLAVDADESVLPGESPADYTQRVCELKVRLAVKQHSLSGQVVVIGADTTVARGDEILVKPEDSAEARQMLQSLRGHTHEVYTAIALLNCADDLFYQDLAVTEVQMRQYSEEEITAYIDSGDPFDKAGSYAIQNRQFQPVETIQGCYANVVGLPLCHVVRALRQWGIQPAGDVPAACQQAHQIECPVYESILNPDSIQ